MESNEIKRQTSGQNKGNKHFLSVAYSQIMIIQEPCDLIQLIHLIYLR